MKGCYNCAHGAWLNGEDALTEICVECNYAPGYPSNWEEKRITNADRIRAMTDEELANFIVERTVNESTLHRLDKDHGLTAVQIEAIKHNVYCAFMQWLQQPAEGEAHE